MNPGMHQAGRALVMTIVSTALVACTQPVQHGLDETQANLAVGLLERAGVGAHKEAEEGSGGGGDPVTFTVSVARADGPRALDLLRAEGLPRAKHGGFATVYGEPSLIPTATEERARYMQALAGEIEKTLETIEGVVAARVHLVLEERDPLAPPGAPQIPARAAILIKARPGANPLPESDVRKLVAGSVPGLVPESVSVVLAAAPQAQGAVSDLVAVGPLRVSRGSKSILLYAIVGALVLLGLLAGLLLTTARKLANLERTRATRS
jgi:type III secretion protein J